MRLEAFDEYMRNMLAFEAFESIDPSLNGLQVGRRDPEISKVAFAVDACMETFDRAVLWGADLLVVHHGVFWGRVEPIRGTHYERIRRLLEEDLGLYAIHLPLDEHMSLGNNAQMAEALGLLDVEPFGRYKGAMIGCRGQFAQPTSIDRINRALFSGTENAIRVLPFGATEIKSVGLVSGGGPSAIDEAIALGLDLFITGDAAHTVYHRALESSMSVVFGGHYLTEIWGVNALAEKLAAEHPEIETTFIDVPTGL